jgi:nitroimidazol reductase NimA-like FMN-containing flavoprotein (pyridoxamine 5'-phosphate oxidase superfamily)
MSSTYPQTSRTTLRRIPSRGSYDRAAVHAILDEALVCHVGFAVDGQPLVLPTTFVRDGEMLYVHGAAANRMLRALAGGVPACLTVSLMDGLVLARSAFHHSMNYRAVVVFGTAREVTRADEKLRVLRLLIEKMSPGRFGRVRAPSEKELRATTVLALGLEEVSAKIRRGPPLDDSEDMTLPIWAGVVPLALRAGVPEPDEREVEPFLATELPRAVT